MIIVIQCRDQVGLVAAISGVLAKRNINIYSLREYVDQTENRFFIRLEVADSKDLNSIEKELNSVLPQDAIVKVNPTSVKKIIVMATKEYHCLADILIRNYFKTLHAEVQCVIANHPDLEDICRRFEVPFFCISSKDISKQEFEQKILQQINAHQYDYIVLAKFMRILSPEFVAQFPNKIINIHHSFLPAFIGADPYQKAHQRGVKLIGATAHFVTKDLDEGPIIAQQIIPVNHSLTAEDMMKSGKEVETAVLASALRSVFEDRVFAYNNKTVVFEH